MRKGRRRTTSLNRFPLTKSNIDRYGLLGKVVAIYKDDKLITEDRLILVTQNKYSEGMCGLYFETECTVTTNPNLNLTIQYISE